MHYRYEWLDGPMRELPETLNEYGAAGWRVVYFDADDGYWWALVERAYSNP